MLHYRDAEHLRCGSAIDIPAFRKGVKPPLLPGKPRQHPCLNCGKVCHDKPAAGLWHKGCPNQFRQYFRGGFIEQIQIFKPLLFYQTAGKIQIRDVILGKVLYLHQASSPAPRAVRSIKLKQAMHPAVRADRALNGFILFHTGLCHQKTEFQYFQNFSVRLRDQPFDRLFIQLLRFHTMLGKPTLNLRRRIGIRKPGQFISSGRDHLPVLVITENCILHQLLIHQNPTVIDFLIHPVQLHFRFWDRKLPQLLPDLPLRIHIPNTIGFEPFPFLWGILRPVPSPSAVCFCGFAWHGEEPDKVSTFLQFFPLYIQHLTHVIQRQGKGKHGRLDCGTLPSVWRKSPAQIPGNTGALKLSIERCFCDCRIFQGIQYLLWKFLPAGKVCDPCWLLIKGIGKK